MNFNRDHTLVPWDTIDTVLLDMDGTLLDLNYDNQIFSHLLPSAFADYHSLTLEEARQQLNDHMTKLKGTMDFYRLDYWHKATKVDVDRSSSVLARSKNSSSFGLAPGQPPSI